MTHPVLRAAALAFLSTASFAVAQQPASPSPAQTEKLTLDARAAATPFPHFWEKTFGSGRAILSLRESYRDDLRTVKAATDFQSIRFHGIFLDEVGVYDPDRVTRDPGLASVAAHDASAYNFTYVDQIYDGLLKNGVRPYVELSFMPRKMASDPNLTQSFFYKPVVSPPKDYALWDGMIRAFAEHLIARYGLDEVSTWKFEVWNEPNLDFWGGNPRQPTYWTLYDHTARALKSVSPRLQVGGPATAQAAWVDAFLAHVKAENVPVDFVSSHVYANDLASDVFGTNEKIPRDQMVFRAVEKIHKQILASPYPHLPFIMSEYNASYSNEPNVTDSPYLGAWLANTIRQCDGLTDTMALWDFSDVFEEQGVPRTPFYGGFGLVATDHIPKASLNAFRALHMLGTERLPLNSETAFATRTADGRIVLALYNYAPPTGEGPTYTMPHGPAGPAKSFDLHLDHVRGGAAVQVFRVDDDHGNAVKAFNAMGRPPGDLTPAQVKELQAAGAMAPPESMHLEHGNLRLMVAAHGLAVVVIGKE